LLPDRPVVVIDDDPNHLEMLVTVLERAGFVAAGFTNSRDALYHLIDHPAALAVVDLCMPDLDGLELVRRLQISRPELPVIGISGADRVSSFMRLMKESGAVVALSKPVTPSAFVATVRDVLARATAKVAS
jgi:DNA-binding NtrC family response regulator